MGRALGRDASGQRARAGESDAGGGRALSRAGRRHDRRALELGGAARLGDRVALGLRRIESRRAHCRSDIARNYAKDGILSYVVAPGIVHTPMSEISAAARGGIDAVNAALAMGEMVPPGEVADLIAYLATGRARHLTGATIDVNGATYIR